MIIQGLTSRSEVSTKNGSPVSRNVSAQLSLSGKYGRAERAAKDEVRAKARAEAKAKSGYDDDDDAPVIARKKPPAGKALKADAPGENVV